MRRFFKDVDIEDRYRCHVARQSCVESVSCNEDRVNPSAERLLSIGGFVPDVVVLMNGNWFRHFQDLCRDDSGRIEEPCESPDEEPRPRPETGKKKSGTDAALLPIALHRYKYCQVRQSTSDLITAVLTDGYETSDADTIYRP